MHACRAATGWEAVQRCTALRRLWYAHEADPEVECERVARVI